MINFTGCHGGRSYATAYNADREQMKAAVEVFMEMSTNVSFNHTQGEALIVNKSVIGVNVTEVIPDKEYYVIAVFPMLTSSQPQGILKVAPPATAHPRNCFRSGANAEPNVTICAVERLCHYFHNCSGSYVWLTTKDGDIASICIGAECEAHGEDGYQDVYP